MDELELDYEFKTAVRTTTFSYSDHMERRVRESATERRTVARGGRRDGDRGQPWYLRRPILLAIASFVFVGWQRVRRRGSD